MQENFASLKKTARLAGLLYFLLAALGFCGLMWVSLQTIVRNDAVATAAKILANESLFRTGIALHISSAVCFLLLAPVLYKLFRDVNIHRARVLVVLMIVQVPVVFVLESFKLTALLTLKGQVFKTFPLSQTEDIAFAFLKMHGNGLALLELFWGLWLLPFAQLVWRSQFIPRILGALLLLAGLGYTIDSLTTILLPGYHPVTQKIAFAFSGLGELSMIGWLLLKGVRDASSGTNDKETPEGGGKNSLVNRRPL